MDKNNEACPNCGKALGPGDDFYPPSEVDITDMFESSNYSREEVALFCPHCGEHGPAFVAAYLRSCGVEFPEGAVCACMPELLEVKFSDPVSKCPDALDISDIASNKFAEGLRGVFKIIHNSGSIVAVPVRTADGWVVYVRYFDELSD
jgi:hypothetical protein